MAVAHRGSRHSHLLLLLYQLRVFPLAVTAGARNLQQVHT